MYCPAFDHFGHDAFSRTMGFLKIEIKRLHVEIPLSEYDTNMTLLSIRKVQIQKPSLANISPYVSYIHALFSKHQQ